MRVWSCAGQVFAMLLPSQTLPSLLEPPHIFLWCQYKKTYGKNIIITQTQRKEICIEICWNSPDIHLFGSLRRCFAWRKRVVDAFLFSLGLQMSGFNALKPISSPLSPPIYLGMLKKFLNFLNFKLVSFRVNLIDERSAKFCHFP